MTQSLNYKIWRKPLIIIGSIALMGYGVFWVFIYGFKAEAWRAREDNSEICLRNVIADTLNMPKEKYQVSSKSDAKEHNWYDLEPISEQEWKDIKCEYSEKQLENYNKYRGNKVSGCLFCIRPQEYSLFGIRGRGNANDYLSVPTGMSNSPCIVLTFNEYILRYPKILNNILKIAEKPCHYGVENSYYRSHLYCDSFKKGDFTVKKTCVLLQILDSSGRLRLQMRIPRKDNIHLFNLTKK